MKHLLSSLRSPDTHGMTGLGPEWTLLNLSGAPAGVGTSTLASVHLSLNLHDFSPTYLSPLPLGGSPSQERVWK